MRYFSRKLLVTISGLFLIGTIFVFVVVLFGLSIFIPGTDTMAPFILGPSPMGGKADVVLLQTRFRHSNLRPGDVVWVQFTYKGQTIDALRFVAAIPGDRLPQMLAKDMIEQVPTNCFFVLAANTNGVDSREVGYVEMKNIRGKVMCVFPIGKLSRKWDVN